MNSLHLQLSKTFRAFFSSQKISGGLLLLVTIISLVLSNSSHSAFYISVWSKELQISGLPHFTLLHFINEGLMTFFFFLVGIEMKRELISGELKGFNKAIIPVSAAVGGMLIPALIYFFFNKGTSTSHGWGIPMATDIAFAIGIISILGDKISNTAKVFITALAVVDDLGAVLVIALFYSANIKWLFLIAGTTILILIVIINQKKKISAYIYVTAGILLWYCILMSGINSTIAGVLLAAIIPYDGKEHSLLEKFESVLHKPVNFIIIPAFAMANTAIAINGNLIGELQTPEGLGIFFGLILGKPIGIVLAVLLTLFLFKRKMPNGINFQSLIGLGFLGGIGFTMSIFITMVAFDDPQNITGAKISIITASLVAGCLGYFILHFQKKVIHD